MRKVIWLLIIVRCMLLPTFAADELAFAQVIYRHGNRTIFSPYKNYPYDSPIFWPEGINALTNAGKQLQYELGQYLRRRYDKLIGPGNDPKKVYIRSSDTDKTLMSALCNAAGMFTPSKEQIWKDSFDWQPVPIHTIPLEDDYLVYQSIPCDRADKMLEELNNSEAMTALLDRYSGLLEYLKINTGINPETNHEIIDELYYFHDALTIESARGLLLPDWAQNVLKYDGEKLENFVALYHGLKTYTIEMQKMKTGFLIKEIFDRFKNKTLSLLDPDRSMWIYSAHDTTIVNILNALNVFEIHIPPYAASIHFELRKSEHDYYVQFFYRKDNSEYIPPIKLRVISPDSDRISNQV